MQAKKNPAIDIALELPELALEIPLPTPTYLTVSAENRERVLAFVSAGIRAATGRAVLAFAQSAPAGLTPPVPGGSTPQGWLLLDDGAEALSGVVPCPSMPNHGTLVDSEGNAWIVTSPGDKGWSEESDVWHEWAHAVYAPVPPFLQQTGAPELRRFAESGGGEINEGAAAALLYFACEIIVCGLVGETRPTETGLPVAETPEMLAAALAAWHRLLPDAGFGGFSGMTPTAADLLPSVLHVVPVLRRFATALERPSSDEFQAAIREECLV